MGTYTPTGSQVGKAFKYGSQGRNVLDTDLVNSTNLLDERTAAAHQSELQSKYLNDLTESDSRYMQNARLQAMEGAAGRGQFNSSIGVGAASRQALDKANEVARGDAEVGMANTAARNLRANKEYDAFSALNRASYDNKTGMLADSIDAANLFNQNDMAALINKGSAFDTQQYGLQNKKVDQGYLMDAKAQDQANSLINKGVDQGYLLDSKGWDQQYNLDTLSQEQKYDFQDRADEWKYTAADLAKRNEYIQAQDDNKHANSMVADAAKYANDGFMESLRQYGGIQQQFVAGYSQIQSSSIPASQKETQLRLLYNQTQGAMTAMSAYSKTGASGAAYTGGTGTTGYNETGVEETYKPGETAIQRDFTEVSESLNEIYGEVRVGGGMDSPQEDLINGYQDAVSGLNDSELREVIRPYSEKGLTNDNWEEVVLEMANIGNGIKQEKKDNAPPVPTFESLVSTWS
ncbi:MAG: hypothetical protein DRI46_11635 [Chloroflexi bacterium]|nr:MAG: hypothetical protein DRI46_11635 [Chloroflexota bacterium]